MKTYNLDTTITFGKHYGKTIEAIIVSFPSYIQWCIMNLDHFLLSENAWNKLLNHQIFKLSEHTADAQIKKQRQYSLSREIEPDEQYNNNSVLDDYDNSGEEYGWYNGWSDDAINYAFDGDPSATWNVD